MSEPTPSIGRAVHYVSYGTPVRADGSQAFVSQCRAADVTEVDPNDPNRVGLMVKNPSGSFFLSLAEGGASYHDGAETPGDLDCPNPHAQGPHRYCACGWTEASLQGGTWHWPERV